MARFFLPPEHRGRGTLSLSGAEAHHALHVLRLREGDALTVLDGVGNEYACQAGTHSRDRLSLTVLNRRFIPPAPSAITLLQALPKGKLIEAIVQKATELGVHRIVPLLSERVVTRLGSEEAAQRGEKLQAIAVEAIKQCGNPWLPRIDAPITFSQFLARNEPFELSLFGSLRPDSPHPRKRFEAFRAAHGKPPNSIAIWIGPEGDFTPKELDEIERAGGQAITLGPLVLRSETAAIYSMSILRYELQSSDAT